MNPVFLVPVQHRIALCHQCIALRFFDTGIKAKCNTKRFLEEVISLLLYDNFYCLQHTSNRKLCTVPKHIFLTIFDKYLNVSSVMTWFRSLEYFRCPSLTLKEFLKF